MRLLTLQEESPRLVVTGDTLKERKGVADSIAGMCRECRGTQERVYRCDLLQEAGHDAKGVPQDQCKVFVLLPLLAELQKRCFSASLRAILCGRRVGGLRSLTELSDEMIDGERRRRSASRAGAGGNRGARGRGWPGSREERRRLRCGEVEVVGVNAWRWCGAIDVV